MLTQIAAVSLILAVICCLWLIVDIIRHPQHMAIMNFVWPLTALYAGPLAVALYLWFGRQDSHDQMQHGNHSSHVHSGHAGHSMHGEQHSDMQSSMNSHDMSAMKEKPFWQSVVLGVTHCGSGCSVGDIIVEGGMHILVPAVLSFTGASLVFFTWTIDYLFALLFGIAFQYFSIVPMRQLSFNEGLITAFKVDFFSLTFWQVGMYGWMAICLFGIFGTENPLMAKTSPVFWFMMQIAMLAGFITAFPINWWLISKGIKERM
ncbi:hypothetical protein Enr10x_48940 [Gimesia panareensis]|uniref:DUF4396 domain-containing protein n=1 Tax=Gimesia panareensis TaxID=2527978 RepID=A0A517QD54_9PLAN|nr:DUF4396 domain-containing protein [Gimesia panareensis]QDT29539.1 hypothetical protein Enr10x_48940 [Gimesia panareensis]